MPARSARFLLALWVVASLSSLGLPPCACAHPSAAASGHEHCAAGSPSGPAYRSAGDSCVCPCMRAADAARATLDHNAYAPPNLGAAVVFPALRALGSTQPVLPVGLSRPSAAPPSLPPLVLRI